MPKAHEDWKVLAHEPVVKLAENLWWVRGAIPGMSLKRVMTVARLADGRLALHSPIALEAPAMAELEAHGRVTEAGRAAFARRDERKDAGYSYEQRYTAKLEPEQERRFRAHRKAWAYFESEAPWYRRTTTHWVVSAKREESCHPPTSRSW